MVECPDIWGHWNLFQKLDQVLQELPQGWSSEENTLQQCQKWEEMPKRLLPNNSWACHCNWIACVEWAVPLPRRLQSQDIQQCGWQRPYLKKSHKPSCQCPMGMWTPVTWLVKCSGMGTKNDWPFLTPLGSTCTLYSSPLDPNKTSNSYPSSKSTGAITSMTGLEVATMGAPPFALHAVLIPTKCSCMMTVACSRSPANVPVIV